MPPDYKTFEDAVVDRVETLFDKQPNGCIIGSYPLSQDMAVGEKQDVSTWTVCDLDDNSSEGHLDDVFHALADSTRRDILRRGFDGDSSVSKMAEAYPMSFAAVQKHVAVLERAGLITKHRRGRELLVHTDVDAVKAAKAALDQLEITWRGRVDRMSSLLSKGSGPD